MLELEFIIVVIDLGSHLDLFELHLVLLLLRLASPAVLLVLEFSVVHDAAHGRSGRRGDLDEIEAPGLREGERLTHRNHTHLLAVVADHPHLRHPDPLVDANLGLLAHRNGVTSVAGVDGVPERA